MINKLLNIIVILLLISACNKEFNETKLLTPPNLDKILEDKDQNKGNKRIEQKSKVTKKDIADIKKLLLE